MGRVDHAVDAGGLGGSEQRAEVLRILERIEHENERCLVALDGSGEDVVQAGELALGRDERDALMAVETGKGCKGAAFHLHYRDAQVGCVQDKLLKSLATLGHNEESDRLASGDERLLDGVAAGNEFLVLTEKPCRGRSGLPGPRGRSGHAGPGYWALIAARAGSVVRPGRPLHEWRPRRNGLAPVDWLGVGGRRGAGCRLDTIGRVEIGLLGRIGVSVEADRLVPAGHGWRDLWSTATEPEAGPRRARSSTEICAPAKARPVWTRVPLPVRARPRCVEVPTRGVPIGSGRPGPDRQRDSGPDRPGFSRRADFGRGPRPTRPGFGVGGGRPQVPPPNLSLI